MKNTIKRVTAMLCVGSLIAGCLSGCANNENTVIDTAGDVFVPSLDTQKSLTLEVTGFMGNFEALDQVVNDFNAYYPNVNISYEQNGSNELVDYLNNNGYVDIFMTSENNVRFADNESTYVVDRCLDLSKEDIDTGAIDPKLIEACTVDGKLVRIPLAKTMCGMVVNKTLLAREGIEVPENYEEFLSACEELKSRGYVPIQGSKIHVYSDMMLPMAMCILGNSEELSKKVNDNDTSYADELREVLEKLDTIISKGYTSYELNSTYPDDNYDQAILKFFEGDVPFWIANTEQVSGMKKRESKSEKFSANPFDYEFVNVPLSDDGVYVYEEPWYGFSVNNKSANIDYAVEFINFIMREEELNKLASVKGMPSVTLNNDDKRYNNALVPGKVKAHYVLNGNLSSTVTAAIANTCNGYGAGRYESIDQALEDMKEAK